ncbi:transcriptional regulator family: Fungal Specific TF [Penicillium sp. DV-2018c]|nr:transcriptional regulator family: Fungal Specific TF [Penicillium sp. DV-2018c]
MTSRENARGRLRSHEACLNCSSNESDVIQEKEDPMPRRETVLFQLCSTKSDVSLYLNTERFKRSADDRLAFLEEKVNLILSGARPTQTIQSDQPREAKGTGNPETSYPTERRPSIEPTGTAKDQLFLGLGYEDPISHPSSSAIAKAIDLYFEYCHRQPIWCFEREEIADPTYLSEELVCSLLALTSRFSRDHDHLQHYGDSARSLIMLRMANGTVELETIESLCLLSYSSVLDGNLHLGRFHLGLALHLCRSAALDLESSYGGEGPMNERKKRLYWSLQCLEQYYGQQNGYLCLPSELMRTFFVTSQTDRTTQDGTEINPPPLPRDDLGCTKSSDTGIWSLAVHFGWAWSRVRRYVSECARNRLKEPWRHDSMYSMILSDLTEIENKLSQCHRYDSVKFYERTAEQLKINRKYWTPWLKLQFTYHSIMTVLNHPFLYIVASQYNENLTIPNTFWRRSSELVLLHATWVVRLIDMITEKKFRLIDPFFGHVAAMAATVHLYYCCAADARLKYKSKVDFTKCRRFLKSFISFSPACHSLDLTLDKMTRIAAGSESIDYEWEPDKIHLSIPLMWDVLQLNCKPKPHEVSTGGLLHPSLTPTCSTEEDEDNLASTLEVIVAISPNVTVNTADGGLAAHMPPNMPRVSSAPASPDLDFAEKLLAPADSLMTNTPWLWADPPQFVDMDNNLGYPDSESGLGNIDGFSTWWDFGNL